MSLPESALPCSSHLISAPCTDFTTYIFCTITLLFSLSKHTHTHKHNITILHYPSSQAQEHYIFFLHYPHQQPKITFHFPPGHRHCKNHCTLYNRVRPFLYLETLCVNMFSLCVCICDLCMYVGEVYKCICVFVYVYKLLDDLNFPRD